MFYVIWNEWSPIALRVMFVVLIAVQLVVLVALLLRRRHKGEEGLARR